MERHWRCAESRENIHLEWTTFPEYLKQFVCFLETFVTEQHMSAQKQQDMSGVTVYLQGYIYTGPRSMKGG